MLFTHRRLATPLGTLYKDRPDTLQPLGKNIIKDSMLIFAHDMVYNSKYRGQTSIVIRQF